MIEERTIEVAGGWTALFSCLATGAALLASFISGATRVDDRESGCGFLIALGVAGGVASLFTMMGLFIVNPSETRVLQRFGRHVGSVKPPGLRWTNPFKTRARISARMCNFESARLKAIVAARSLIAEGAVGMMEMALHRLSEREVVTLDDDRRAAMVSNLLVVLCGETATQPVVNTGTIYQ